MQKITPFLMFQTNPQKAIDFYLSIFPDGKDLGGGRFKLMGQNFMAYNGGNYFEFSEGLSLFVSCEDQKEIDYYWEKLSKGGAKSQCGWLKDKYGLSWQIIPKDLGKYLAKDKTGKVMQVMLSMRKLNIAALKKAYGA